MGESTLRTGCLGSADAGWEVLGTKNGGWKLNSFPSCQWSVIKSYWRGEKTSEFSVFVSGSRCLLMSLAVISAQKVKVALRSHSLVCLSSGGDVGDVFRTLKDVRRDQLSSFLQTAAVKSSSTLSLSAFELWLFIFVSLCVVINRAVGQFTAPANRPTVSNDFLVPRTRL